ncbi:hypothetical protein COI59_31410 [Bacillus toyonensis]|nr:hypothetical protein COI59_31410 [Bacillus toyonensis]
MNYNSNIISFIFIFISIVAYIFYIVRDTIGTHPIIVLSISFLAILGTLVFINPNEDRYLQTIILIGVLVYLILLLSTFLIEIMIQ